MARGRYVVLEGPKGVGKTTQAMMLESALKSARIPVVLISEDDNQNDISLQSIEALVSDTSHPLSNRTKLLLHNAARSRSLDLIRSHVEDGIVCIADQNYLTTLTMQYYGLHSIDNYENFNQIIDFANHSIEPDITIVLDTEVANLIERINAYALEDIIKIYDESLMERLRAGYLWEAKERGYQIVYAIGSKEDVFNSIWGLITENLLPESASQEMAIKSPVHVTSVGEILEQRSTNNQQTITKTELKPENENINVPKQTIVQAKAETYLVDSQNTLSRIITNIKGNVYGFRSTLNPETIGHIVSHAASKRSDIRSVLLNEYCAVDKEARRKLLNEAQISDQHKTLSTIGRYIVIERISNLAARYIEQAGIEVCYRFNTTTIPKSKPQPSKGSFYIPSKLDQKVKKQFQQDIEQIINLRGKIIKQLINYLSKVPASTIQSKKPNLNDLSEQQAIAVKLTKPLVPVATYSSIVLYTSINSFRKLIDQLTCENLPELQLLAKNLYQELQILLSESVNELNEDQNQTIKFDSKPINQQKIVNLINKFLPKIKSDTDDELTLIQYSPRNEINLIDELIYKQSNSSALALKTTIGSLDYEKKLELFNVTIQTAITEAKYSNSILNKISYEFDIISDYGIIVELIKKQIVRQVDWQDLTPRHGFAVPKLIEDAGVIEDFEQAFTICLNLYSSLQTDHLSYAQYATLFGHKQHAKIKLCGVDGLQIHKLCQQSETYPGVNNLLQQICDKIAEVHPVFFDLISR